MQQNKKVNTKSTPNHRQYLLALSKMGAEKRLMKAFEMSALTKELFFAGLHKRFPNKTEAEITVIELV